LSRRSKASAQDALIRGGGTSDGPPVTYALPTRRA